MVVVDDDDDDGDDDYNYDIDCLSTAITLHNLHWINTLLEISPWWLNMMSTIL